MSETHTPSSIDQQIATRLKLLRAKQEWSLDQLAAYSGVSRATLSRLEKAEVSPTAQVLGKLCTAFGLTLSHLLQMVEDDYLAAIPQSQQEVWQDSASGFQRKIVSPPAGALAGEVLECTLPPDTLIAYENPPRRGLEHHLVMKSGLLEICVDGVNHRLRTGDCLRYQAFGASQFSTASEGANYFLFMV